MVKANNRRSPDAQLAAMRRLWPEFFGKKTPDGVLVWIGSLQPKAQAYNVGVLWKPRVFTLPYVIIMDPPIKPPAGCTFEEIPHLIYDSNEPSRSALCLFDPDGNEWSESDLIAEKTIYWASEWLMYYELWHLTGEWLGPSVGYESVAQIRASEAKAMREAAEHVY